jgi:hypothetical protein
MGVCDEVMASVQAKAARSRSVQNEVSLHIETAFKRLVVLYCDGTKLVHSALT